MSDKLIDDTFKRDIDELKKLAERQDPCEHIFNSSVVLDLIEHIEELKSNNFIDRLGTIKRLVERIETKTHMVNCHQKEIEHLKEVYQRDKERIEKLENALRKIVHHHTGIVDTSESQSTIAAKALKELDK